MSQTWIFNLKWREWVCLGSKTGSVKVNQARLNLLSPGETKRKETMINPTLAPGRRVVDSSVGASTLVEMTTLQLKSFESLHLQMIKQAHLVSPGVLHIANQRLYSKVKQKSLSEKLILKKERALNHLQLNVSKLMSEISAGSRKTHFRRCVHHKTPPL